MTIMLYKLSTGEEVIGNEASHADVENIAMIARPLIVVRALNQDGSFGVQLLPYFSATADIEILFYREHIIALCLPTKALESAYLQQTSGILLGGTLRSQ